VLNDDVPASIQDWADDVDLLGNDLNVWLKDFTRHGIQAGLAHTSGLGTYLRGFPAAAGGHDSGR
jgi:hypothetical protein